MWWGLGLLLPVVLLMSLVVALDSPVALVVVVTISLTGWIAGIRIALRRSIGRFTLPGPGEWVLVGALVLAAAYLALAALGPVTNYDSGLYHLGAIRYAFEYPTIPGLANLYFPLGYSTTQFPFAALLGNGLWGVEGYRLANGLIMFLVALELVLRMGGPRRTPGFFVLTLGVLASWVPMVALSDYWVTSPSQDSTALVLTVVASAYLADAVAGRREWLSAGATALLVGVILVAVRPTLAPFTASIILVLIALALRRHPGLCPVSRSFAPVALVAVAMGAVIGLRDRTLSGWLGYPASFWSFDVPWRTGNPAQYRDAILGFHRNPQDIWNSVDGWSWVIPWFRTRTGHWETYEFLALVGLALFGTLAAVRFKSSTRLLRWSLIAMMPSAIAIATWWLVTPPSYRFIWGPLFTLATIPAGMAWWWLARGADVNPVRRRRFVDTTVAVCALPIALVALGSAAFRFDWATLNGSYQLQPGFSVTIAPVPYAVTRELQLSSGLVITYPEESDQCWASYPLCSPDPAPGLTMRDPFLGQGFTTELKSVEP